MEIVEEWDSSFGGKLVAVLLTSLVLAIPVAFTSAIGLAEPDPNLQTAARASPAAPRTSSTDTVPRSTSCNIVIIEAIFSESRVADVLNRGRSLDLEVEFYDQSSQVIVAFVRFDSDDELDRILDIARVNGWGDSYVSVLEQLDCEPA